MDLWENFSDFRLKVRYWYKVTGRLSGREHRDSLESYNRPDSTKGGNSFTVDEHSRWTNWMNFNRIDSDIGKPTERWTNSRNFSIIFQFSIQKLFCLQQRFDCVLVSESFCHFNNWLDVLIIQLWKWKVDSFTDTFDWRWCPNDEMPRKLIDLLAIDALIG